MKPKSRHSLWQARWEIDSANHVATHDSGLRVRLEDGHPRADNETDVVQLLATAHGDHNARAMVQLLIRQGSQLLIDPYSRGWRN